MQVSKFNYLSVITFLLLGALSQDVVAETDSVKVTISGTIKDTTCAVTNRTPTFKLADVTVKDFQAKAGTTVGSVAVPITFANCDASGVALKIKVTGTADPYSATTFKNTASGTTGATGVALQFHDADTKKTLFKTDGSQAAGWNTKNDGLTIPYTANYISTSATVKAGSFSTVVTIDITYV